MPIEPEAESATIRNRYAGAPRNADWTIDQDWPSCSAREHDRWRRLFDRQAKLLPGRACEEFLEARARLGLSHDGIPDFAILSEKLSAMTGWRVVPVPASFPTSVLRPSRQPPLSGRGLHQPEASSTTRGAGRLPRRLRTCADARRPDLCRFLEAYGKGGRGRSNGRATAQPGAALLVHGRIRPDRHAEGLRIFGAGILSSPAKQFSRWRAHRRTGWASIWNG